MIADRTLENWEQGRAKPNAQAALLINLVKHYPDKVTRLASIYYVQRWGIGTILLAILTFCRPIVAALVAGPIGLQKCSHELLNEFVLAGLWNHNVNKF